MGPSIPFTRREFSNDLYELNTETMEWRLLGPTKLLHDPEFDVPSQPTVRDKAAMVYHGNALWIFAGWGSRILRSTPNSTVSPHYYVGLSLFREHSCVFLLLTAQSATISAANPFTSTVCAGPNACLRGLEQRDVAI